MEFKQFKFYFDVWHDMWNFCKGYDSLCEKVFAYDSLLFVLNADSSQCNTYILQDVNGKAQNRKCKLVLN